MLLTVTRLPSEKIDPFLARFHTIVDKAAQDGQLGMNVRNLSGLLLRGLRVNDERYLKLTEATNGLLPSAQDQLDAMELKIRRMGRVLEHAPGN